MDTFAYLPGASAPEPHPLARYLPVVPSGVVSAYLRRHVPSPGWVLDPFGISPSMAVEIAALGRQVLVAVSNPVTRLLLELASSPPSTGDLRLALNLIAAARKGDERMETHLQSLYLTVCPKCTRSLPAQAFVWEKGQDVPSTRLLDCPCGASGEFPAEPADRDLAVRIASADALHRARLLERLADPDDPDRKSADYALSHYLPRAVYALITLINRMDAVLDTLPRDHRLAVLALLLSACDEASVLWNYPPERTRPRQLVIPSRFMEKNVWLTLERAVSGWERLTPVPLSDLPASSDTAPSLPPLESGGIYLHDGSIRTALPAVQAIQPVAVIAAFPRPSQAYWTLSSLWAGWLFGRSVAAPFKSALRRRRYDWNWHTSALYQSLHSLSPHLPLNTPLFALLTEPEPVFLTATLLAAADAGFDLEGLAVRSRTDPVQVVWRRRAFLREREEQPEVDPLAVRLAVEETLRQAGEPLPYLHLHAAGLATMAADRTLHWQPEAVSTHQAPVQTALESPALVHHSTYQSLESGLWGLSEWGDSEPLADRVEVALVKHLRLNPGASFPDLETTLNDLFPALLTPPLDLLRAVLDSYAIEQEGAFTLRPEEAPTARRLDLDAARQSLAGLASHLGYTHLAQETPFRLLRWLASDTPVYEFHLIASAVAGRILRLPCLPDVQRVLVLPGGRAGLLAYKLERDPSLHRCAESWRLLKFRQLRRIAALPDLTRSAWQKELTADPLEPPEQLKLF